MQSSKVQNGLYFLSKYMYFQGPHQFSLNLIGLGHHRWCVPRGSVQILNAPFVILTQLQRVSVTIEWAHHSIRLKGVLQAQNMAKLMSCHLEEVCA